jgi:hypothetical protein
MPTPKPEKPKEERVGESITILKKLREIGIHEAEPGFLQTKELMSAWVSTGLGGDYTIEFPRFGRKADLVLPSRAGRVASLNLRAPRGGGT